MKSNIVRMYEDDVPFYLVTKESEDKEVYDVDSKYTSFNEAEKRMTEIVGQKFPNAVVGVSNVVRYKDGYVVTYWHTSNIYHGSRIYTDLEDALRSSRYHNGQ